MVATTLEGPDVVLASIATALVTAVGTALVSPVGIAVAMAAGAVPAGGSVGYALFCSPPTEN